MKKKWKKNEKKNEKKGKKNLKKTKISKNKNKIMIKKWSKKD